MAIIATGDLPATAGKMSRAALRKEAQKEKSAERDRNIGPIGSQGVSLSQTILMRQMAAIDFRNLNNIEDRFFMQEESKLTRLQKLATEALEVAKARNRTEDWDKYDIMVADYRAAMENIEGERKEKRKLAKNGSGEHFETLFFEMTGQQLKKRKVPETVSIPDGTAGASSVSNSDGSGNAGTSSVSNIVANQTLTLDDSHDGNRNVVW